MRAAIITFIYIVFVLSGAFLSEAKEIDPGDFKKYYYKELFKTEEPLSSFLKIIVDRSSVFLCDLK